MFIWDGRNERHFRGKHSLFVFLITIFLEVHFVEKKKKENIFSYLNMTIFHFVFDHLAEMSLFGLLAF